MWCLLIPTNDKYISRIATRLGPVDTEMTLLVTIPLYHPICTEFPKFTNPVTELHVEINYLMLLYYHQRGIYANGGKEEKDKFYY